MPVVGVNATAMDEKILTYAIRGLAALITGGGLIGVSNGAWIGRLMLRAFEQHTGIAIQAPHLISDDLYREWSGEIIFGTASSPAFSTYGYLAFTLLLLAHVLFKNTACNIKIPPYGGRRAVGRVARATCRMYVRHYHVVTAALMIALTVIVLGAPTRSALLSRFVLFVVPAVTYLVYFAKDLRSPTFRDAFLYVAILLLFGVCLVSLPRIYGERFFDIALLQVTDVDERPTDPSYRATFVVDEARQTVCHVFAGPHLTLRLRDNRRYTPGLTAVSLRALATENVAGASVDVRQTLPRLNELLTAAEKPRP